MNEAIQVKILLGILVAVSVIAAFVAEIRKPNPNLGKPTTAQETRAVHGNDQLGSSIYSYNPSQRNR